MADYFTYFSFVLNLRSNEAKQYAFELAGKAAEHRFSDDPVLNGFPVELIDVLENWSFEAEENDSGIWFYSQDGGIDAVCAFIQHLLGKFDPEGRVEFEWSNDCSKPRPGAYGGGAAIITAQEILTMNTSDWLRSHAA